MKKLAHKKPQRISQDDLASMAAQGVSRALAARENCMRELSPQELADVSGGALALVNKGIIAGGRPADIYASSLTSQLTVPSLNTSVLNAAALGGTTRMM